MALSSDLISQFVKVTKEDTKTNKETIVYGTVTIDDAGDFYVKFDGSNELTPVSTTSGIASGERVIVMIKNHTATVIGNISSPSVRTEYVRVIETKVTETADKVSGFDTLLADKVSTDEFYTKLATIEEVKIDKADVEALLADKLDVNEANLTFATIEDLEATDANVEKLQTDKLDASEAEITYATIENLEATNTNISELEAERATFESTTTTKLESIEASISELEAGGITTEQLEAKFANIDFSNIGKAAMEYFYSQSGLIEDVTVGDGTITGHLVGVTISGDLIEGNTVVAEKLVIKGEDGLYYKLNTDGVITEAEQTAYNSLNGQVILAKSITASKISVDDLVAFDATIAGINITDGALYSGTKSSVDNTTSGFYLDKDGQLAFGGADNFVKFYKDADGTYKLAISADSIAFATTGKDVETAIAEVNDEANAVRDIAESADEKATNAQTLIAQLSDSISMLVTDGNGTSLMTQTDEGWTFSTADIQATISTAVEQLDSLNTELGDTNHTVDVLQQTVDDLGEIAEYVKIGTYEGEPCIELGEGDSEFKLRITNTRMMFMEGSSVVAYFNNQSLYIKKAVVEEELQQGGFVWKARSNGNLGLVWKGGI